MPNILLMIKDRPTKLCLIVKLFKFTNFDIPKAIQFSITFETCVNELYSCLSFRLFFRATATD